jgi:hypothetical protein
MMLLRCIPSQVCFEPLTRTKIETESMNVELGLEPAGASLALAVPVSA